MMTREGGPAAIISAARENVQSEVDGGQAKLQERSSFSALQKLVGSAKDLVGRADWSQAQQLLKRALQSAEIQIGNALDFAARNLPEGTSSKHNNEIGRLNQCLTELLPLLAKTYFEQDQLDAARALLQRALDTLEVSRGIADKALPMALHELAKVTHEMACRRRHTWGALNAAGELQQAERLYQCAVTAAEGLAQQHGPQEVNTPFHHSSMSRFYLKEENLEMAEKIAKNAIQKANRVWGEDHVETQECLDALADILSKRRNFAEAEPLHAKCVEVLLRTLPADSIEVAYALEDLGRDLQGIGSLAKAEAALDQSLQIVRSLCPPGEYDSVYVVRASLLRACGEVKQQRAHAETRRDRRQERLNIAVQLLEKALANCLQQFGAQHPDVQPYYKSLAVCYQALGRMTDAEPLNDKILQYDHDVKTRQKLHDIRHTLQSTSGGGLQKVMAALNDETTTIVQFEQHKTVVERAERKVKRHVDDTGQAEKLHAVELSEKRAEHVVHMETKARAKNPRHEHDATLRARRVMEKIEVLVTEVNEAVAKAQAEQQARHKDLARVQRAHHELELFIEKSRKIVKSEKVRFAEEYGKLFQEAFVLLDDDGSGSLDHAEIRRILVMLELDMSDQEFEDMVVAVDEDGTGDVSCDEFVDLMVLRSLDTMIK